MSQFQYLSFQVAKKESELVKRTKAVQKANDQLKTIQEMIENELADNKHSEYLLKVFKMRDASKSKVLCIFYSDLKILIIAGFNENISQYEMK